MPTFHERLRAICKRHQTPQIRLENDETTVTYYPEEGTVELMGEFTERQLAAICDAMYEMKEE